MNPPILEMKGISKRFAGVTALDAVDLEVHSGEIVALIGENGAGKSTLMKILGGVYQPDLGEILIDSLLSEIGSVSDAIERGIGFIHQELSVLDNLDIAANVFLGREPVWGGPLRLIDQKKLHAQATVYLHRLGLDLPSDTLAANLSLAQKQMVEIARALSLHARLLIMDEPTSSLTLAETEKLMEVVKEMRASGVSIIYISHRLSEIEEIADRVVVLRDGKNAGALARSEIDHDRMVRLMVGRDLNQFYVSTDADITEGFVQVCGLRTQRYPHRRVTFDIGRGEILGFAGLVGSGRSEVAQAIFGVDRAMDGEISIDGRSVTVASPRDAIAEGIYLVPEDRRQSGLVVDMTIRENITLPSLDRCSASGLIQPEKERKRAEEISARLNVKTPSVEEKVANLSGGNQQKVALAKWLALEPQLLIFDEPTRGVDVGSKSEIYAQMRALAQKGVAIMMISSDMEEILGVSDRVAVMHEGAITGFLQREQCSQEAIMRLAVGRHTS